MTPAEHKRLGHLFDRWRRAGGIGVSDAMEIARLSRKLYRYAKPPAEQLTPFGAVGQVKR